ncbi:MAG TPA: MFS transporter [Kofleriaceae bacterium]|jgi:MFS family permease
MRLSNRTAFVLLASIIVVFLAGSSAPTPLYPTYQAEWGFSAITITFIFGIYALAVLTALLVIGSLSDYIGRRPVLVVATLVEIVAMVVFARANGLIALLVARVVQGLGVGAAVAAAGAALLDLDRERGSAANAASPGLGSALGALVSGLFVQFLPMPKTLVYCVIAALLALQIVGIYFMRETTKRKPGAVKSLVPHIRVPSELRMAVLLAAPALVAAWALAGFYGSLAPALIRRVLGSTAPVLGGVGLFALAASGALTIIIARHLPARSIVRLGSLLLMVGVAGVLLATFEHSRIGFFVATAVAGAGFGGSFHGGLHSVLSITPADHRAGVLSVLSLIAYLAIGVPAVLGGVRVVHGGGLVGTSYEFGAVVIVLAATAFAGTFLVHGPRLTAEATAPAKA